MYENKNSIAVAYLLRGKDTSWNIAAQRFLASYKQYDAGMKHKAYAIIKGFSDEKQKEGAISLMSHHNFKVVEVEDNTFDIGAYAQWARLINEDVIFCLNTFSEILSINWLAKMIINFEVNNFKLLSATGSFESLSHISSLFFDFPNVHIRSNAFMIDRKLFVGLTDKIILNSKLDAFYFESGKGGMTQQIHRMGKKIGIVGKNGRAYEPRFWPFSDIYRQSDQSNLLIDDNVTRQYRNGCWKTKKSLCYASWKHYIHEWVPKFEF